MRFSWGGRIDDIPPMWPESRTLLVWNDIAETSPEASVVGIPDHLVDAWETEKRSREYLNGTMDPCDVHNIYYSHTYNFEPTEED